MFVQSCLAELDDVGGPLKQDHLIKTWAHFGITQIPFKLVQRIGVQSEESQTEHWCWAALMLVHVKPNTCLGCLHLGRKWLKLAKKLADFSANSAHFQPISAIFCPKEDSLGSVQFDMHKH